LIVAKVNVNKATREELVDVAGLRPQVVDAVLKARDEHHGRLANIDALKEALREVRGVGTATLDQLGEVLSFGAAATNEPTEKTAEVAQTAARAGAETARQTADATRQTADAARQTADVVRQGAEKTAEVTSIVARTGVEAAHRVADRAAEAEKAVAERSSEAATELSQLVVHLVNEQIQANVETLQALARARTVREAVEVQTDFFRANVERATDGASRYVEALTRLLTSMVHVGQEQAKKAA
jgi:hypothetical protein